MFCPQHKKLMRHEGGILVCPIAGCGQTMQRSEASAAASAITKGEQRIDKGLIIEDPTKYRRTDPIDDQVNCDKCGNRGAYYYLRQTRKSDEPTTAFYTCTNDKCGNKWKRAH